jgi:hypothetical protein
MKKAGNEKRIMDGIFLVPGLSTVANAVLQNNGNGLIYGTDPDITWYDYTRDFDTWQNQMDDHPLFTPPNNANTQR